MRSAAVFFPRRHAARSRCAASSARIKSRRTVQLPPRDARRFAHGPRGGLRRTCPNTRDAAQRPRMRPDLLVPRGLIPLWTH